MTSYLPVLRAEAYRTIIRVMQLGRSYSRRLKKLKYEIYELYPSARHAYITIQPAVKTSRPLGIFFKDRILGVPTHMRGWACLPAEAGFPRYTVPCRNP